MTGAFAAESQLLVYCWFLWLYLYIQAVRHARSITCWVTTSGILLVSLAIPIHSGCQACQEHYLLSHNFWYTVTAIAIILAVRGMIGTLPAESQLLVYCCGYTYTFRLSEARQEHYLLSHNFWCTVMAIPIHSGFQAWQEHYLLSHKFWYTVGFSGYTYTFRLSEAWQEHYLLSHNFWCIIVAISIHSGCQRHDRDIACWVTTSGILLVSLAIPIHSGCQYDRSITCWVTTSGILLVFLAIPIHSGCQAWQEHYLPSHSFWYTVVIISKHSGCQMHVRVVSQQQLQYIHMGSQLLAYYCDCTYTFRLSEAWQEHYLLSHNFWYTVVAIPIIQAVIGMTGA